MTVPTYICPHGGDCDDPHACNKRGLCAHFTVAPIDFIMAGVKPAVHFVGFRPATNPQQYENAVRLWGLPDVIHYVWDQRAQREIAQDWDTVVFAKYGPDWPPSPYNYDDSNQPDDPAAKDRL